MGSFGKTRSKVVVKWSIPTEKSMKESGKKVAWKAEVNLHGPMAGVTVVILSTITGRDRED
jgi:hypothetical protein